MTNELKITIYRGSDYLLDFASKEGTTYESLRDYDMSCYIYANPYEEILNEEPLPPLKVTYLNDYYARVTFKGSDFVRMSTSRIYFKIITKEKSMGLTSILFNGLIEIV